MRDVFDAGQRRIDLDVGAFGAEGFVEDGDPGVEALPGGEGGDFDREKVAELVGDDARKSIRVAVDGAVGMVEAALHQLERDQVVDLDEERKAAMVSNLLVVLCGEENARPVLNAGTLHNRFSRRPRSRTMPRKKSFPLRLNEDMYDALKRWADDEFRSVNGQMEYVLRDALRKAGRLRKKDRED